MTALTLRRVDSIYRTIELTQGFHAVVDADAYDMLVELCSWRALAVPTGVYAKGGSGQKNLLMHRVLLPGFETVDHRNGNTLDNRMSNLRGASVQENAGNAKVSSANSSGFKGVTRVGARWRAYIRIDYRQRTLGTYADKELAARAYDAAARDHFGEFAALNFPRPGEMSAHFR